MGVIHTSLIQSKSNIYAQLVVKHSGLWKVMLTQYKNCFLHIG